MAERLMKDSGNLYIGAIPATWKVTKFKRLKDEKDPYPIGDGDHGAIKPEDYIDEGIPYIRVQNLDWSDKLKLDDVAYISAEVSKRSAKSELKPGDILVAKTGATIGKTAIIPNDMPIANTTSSVGKITVDRKHNNRYVYYLLRSDVMNNQMWDSARQKSAQPGFNIDELTEYYVCIPSREEQNRIVVFLDKKVSEIDAVISKTKESIEEYKKLKQSVITETVTKGLDSNTEMKDSDIEWIGKIPAHWNVCKVRHIGLTQNGISKGGDYFGEGDPFVSYGDVYKNYSLPHEVSGLIRSTEEEQKLYSVEKGDVFFTRTSETIEEVGFSCVCEVTIPKATFAGFLIRLRPFNNSFETGYLKYYFRSSHNRFYLVKQMNLVTRASLGQPLLKNMPVLIPDKAEQKAIADYLDDKCSALDNLISKKEQVITELEQYKKSLIYEYVTGKKEVA